MTVPYSIEQINSCSVKIVPVKKPMGMTRGMIIGMADYVQLRKTVIKEITEWCDQNNIEYENLQWDNTFKFKNTEQMMMFILRWS